MAYDVSLITIDHCEQLGEITLTLQALSECPNVPLQTSLNIYVTQKTQFICIKIIYIYICNSHCMCMLSPKSGDVEGGHSQKLHEINLTPARLHTQNGSQTPIFVIFKKTNPETISNKKMLPVFLLVMSPQHHFTKVWVK